jgi:hypothetical protein
MFYESNNAYGSSISQDKLITDIIINTSELISLWGLYIDNNIASKIIIENNSINNRKTILNSYILENKLFSLPIANYHSLFTNYIQYNKLNNQKTTTSTTIVSRRLNASIFISGDYYHLPIKIECKNTSQQTKYKLLTKSQYIINFDNKRIVDDRFKHFGTKNNKSRIILIKRDDILTELTGDSIKNMNLILNTTYERDDNFVIITQDSTDLTIYKMFLWYQDKIYLTIYDNVYKKNVNYNILGVYQIWEIASDTTNLRNTMPIKDSALDGSLTVNNWDNNIKREESIAL